MFKKCLKIDNNGGYLHRSKTYFVVFQLLAF
nr:MAG TPA: hypothetical protein [Caudoviricetes sp.]